MHVNVGAEPQSSETRALSSSSDAPSAFAIFTTMSNAGRVTVTPADGGTPFEANRYMIESGGQRSLLVYWYQGRGRAVASEYWGKVYTVLDSVARRRSDGAMVRVVVPMRRSEEEAMSLAAEFAARVSPELPRFVPN